MRRSAAIRQPVPRFVTPRPTPHADLISSDPEYITIGQTAKAHRHFVDGDAPMSQQVNDPQTRRDPQ